MSIETRAVVLRGEQPGRPRGTAAFLRDPPPRAGQMTKQRRPVQLELWPAGLPRTWWRSGELQEPRATALVTQGGKTAGVKTG
jgi:hypothetical protein